MDLDNIYLPSGILLERDSDYFVGSRGRESSFSGIDRSGGLSAGRIVRLPLVIPDDFPFNLRLGDTIIYVSGSGLPINLPGLSMVERLDLSGIICIDRRNKE